MPTAEEIVQALALSRPIHMEDTMHWCVLCEENLVVYPSDHKEDCPWRLAVEYLRKDD